MIITRFAPSPTGDPHIGNMRSALFAYLFAKSQQGRFLWRIEDTDQKRYNESSVGVLKDALSWLGIAPENIDAPVVQSTRLEEYKKEALKLLEQGDAYVCDCSKERLEELRARQVATGQPPKYDGKCRDLGIKFEEGKTVIRMKTPESGQTAFTDLIRGEVHFGHEVLDDQVILKSDGFPTYHLASVIDDHEMQITHIVRGEEWLPSTPKHLILYQMFGWEAPKYAHLPVILSPTHGKLSKRDGAVGILEYRRLGYLPEALVNFMALLGWNPKTEEEFFSLEKLEEIFTLENVNKAAAIFDINKLNFFNAHYLREISADKLVEMIDQVIINKIAPENRTAAVEIAKQRMNALSDFAEQVKFILEAPDITAESLIFRKSDAAKTKLALEKSAEKLEAIPDWNKDTAKTALTQVVSENNLTNGDVFWSVRFALSGEEKSPPPEELATALGKAESIARIRKAIDLVHKVKSS